MDTSNILALIAQYESGGQNVYNKKYNLNPSYYTASGYYQITNTLWRNSAPAAGISLTDYPTAISAPYNVQTQVAASILNTQGIQPWQGNVKLMAALQSNTQASFVAPASTPDYFTNEGGAGGSAAIPYTVAPSPAVSTTTQGAQGTANGLGIGAIVGAIGNAALGALPGGAAVAAATGAGTTFSPGLMSWLSSSAIEVALVVLALILFLIAVWPEARSAVVKVSNVAGHAAEAAV